MTRFVGRAMLVFEQRVGAVLHELVDLSPAVAALRGGALDVGVLLRRERDRPRRLQALARLLHDALGHVGLLERPRLRLLA